MSGSPSIFLLSSKFRSEKPNYLVRWTMVLSAAQENSVCSICISSKSRNTRLPDKEYFENLVRKLATRDVMNSIQCLVCRAVVEISIANSNSRIYLKTS